MIALCLLVIGVSEHPAYAAADNFANAIQLTGASGQVTDNNFGATKEAGEPDHAGNTGGASVWWKWTAPSNMFVSFDTHNSNFDTLLGVYTGSGVNSLTLVASNDDDENSANNSGVSFQALAGTTYYIAVDGYSATTGMITLNWKSAPPPPNDNFVNAILLTGEKSDPSGVLSSTNIFGATKEPGEPNHAGKPGGKSVWYKWIAPKSQYYCFINYL